MGRAIRRTRTMTTLLRMPSLAAARPSAADYGASRCRSRGNNVTCRMLSASTSRPTHRSKPDGEAAVRRHPVPEGVEIALVRPQLLATRGQRPDVVVVPVQPLPAGDELEAAEDQVEGVRPLRLVRLRVRVERPLGEGVALDGEEVTAVLLECPGAECTLVRRRQVRLVGRGPDQVQGVAEVDDGYLGRHLGHRRAEQLDRLTRPLVDGRDHPCQQVAQHRDHVAVVADEAELDIERHVLGEVPHRVVRLRAEHRPHLVHALEHPHAHLLVELR